jgi:hypothetical protein
MDDICQLIFSNATTRLQTDATRYEVNFFSIVYSFLTTETTTAGSIYLINPGEELGSLYSIHGRQAAVLLLR